ncbi:hypothetical protein [Sporosarcina sp. Te-1]|uniref:hypothetical protein n=1 Tax=Sporosarcina sp. Te-1 TaxID=2818390 RepID=UPI001A9DCEFD|nr:hypothetical protein [Sporosarcina sp. Te-1]QTD40817.1 hypothetical protein J3U78_19050 [Sporosarcina sp. Te-1]
MKKKFGMFLFILLASVGTVYASTNSAQTLSLWYEKSFKEKSEQVGAETATALIRMLNENRMLVKEMNEALLTAVTSHLDKMTGDTKSGIEEYKSSIMQDINTTQYELQKDSFEEYVINRKIEEEIELEFESMLDEILNE